MQSAPLWLAENVPIILTTIVHVRDIENYV